MKLHHDGQAGGFDPVHVNHQLETLEPRVLLTTLFGGDVFEYIDARGQTVRVTVTGDAIVELIGADVNTSLFPTGDGSNVLNLGDLPGYIYSSTLGRTGAINGGLNGADGVQPVGGGRITLADPILGTSTSSPDLVKIQALATRHTPAGTETWGLNVMKHTPSGGTEQTYYQVVRINYPVGGGSPVAMVMGHLNLDATVAEISAASFDPRSGHDNLYFVETHADGRQVLRRVDVGDYNLALLPVYDTGYGVQLSPGGQTDRKVTAIAFDQVQADEPLTPGTDESRFDLVFYTTNKNGDTASGQIVRRADSPAGDFTFTGSSASTWVSLKGEGVADITGIALLGDNAMAAEGHVYATTPGGLLRINLSNGQSQFMGGLVDPDDNRDTKRGGAVADLTWDRERLNPFTGEVGVLVGVDTATNDLIYIDHRARFDTADLFAIYVSQASENASISISVVQALDPANPKHWTERHELPFSDDIGSIRVWDNEANDYILVAAPTNSGGVLIGALTEEVSDQVDDENLRPILSAYLEGALGVRPAGLDELPFSSNNINAGVLIGQSMVEYYNADATNWSDRMLGMNLDLISAMSINRHGRIAVIDSDQRSATGSTVGDQLAFINRNTGQANALYSIFDNAVPANPIIGVTSLAYGFADMTQVEQESDQELYATVGGRFGVMSFSGADAVFTELGDLTALTGLASLTVRSMAFAAGADIDGKQFLYVLADPNGHDGIDQSILLRLEYTTDIDGQIDGLTNAITIGSITSANLGDMTFDGAGRLLAVDRTQGRLVQINTVTGGQTYLSAAGTLRSTVGGLAYDFQGEQILVVDNATGQTVIANEGGNSESAALMRLKPQATGQSFGSILVGGTIMGQVNASGSLVELYAGWMLLDQVNVNGDLRSVISTSEIGKGSHPTTDLPRTNFNVEGRVGRIFTPGDANFQLVALNQNTGLNLTADQMNLQEVEAKIGPTPTTGSSYAAQAFKQFRLYNGDLFFNDTIETAQILGTVASGVEGQPDIIRVDGVLHNGVNDPGSDLVDYYAVSLMAGQSIAVRLESYSSNLPIGVYDPDGRLIASHWDAANSALWFTTDRPGLYTIGVGAYRSDIENVEGRWSYTLVIENAGTMTVGGIDVGGTFQNQIFGDVFEVQGGDFGVLKVGESILFDGTEVMPTNGVLTQYNDIRVVDGNLRAVIASQIGNGSQAHANAWGLNADVTGSVGLVRATSGILTMSDSYIGGDVQWIDGVGQVFLRLYVDGGIGNIHAGSMPSYEGGNVSILHVNYDNQGQDGIIDLIDVAGDLGTSIHGGVQITTGAGGNVRYMRVGGNVYQDTLFSGGDAGVLTGQAISVQDDSGARVNLGATYGGNLQVTTYGIRGSGGSVIVKVVSTTGLVAQSVTGLNLRPAEISEIIVSNAGNDVTVNRLFNTVTQGFGAQPVSVSISGGSPLDVFSITGGGFDTISNTTAGELVNITARSVGLLYAAGSIGIAKRTHDTVVMSRQVIADTFPFEGQRNAVRVGDARVIQAGTSLGNIIADSSLGGTGTIGDLMANCDNVNTTGGFEGISGAVYASGDIFRVNIGEGLANGGSGQAPTAGLFVKGKIQSITNQGLGSDIRGTIGAVEGIGSINLVGGGSIIGAYIATVTDLNMLSPQNIETLVINSNSYIDRITLTGNGGIIGSSIVSNRIGDVSVRGGFGVINSAFGTTAGGTLGNFYADGYGFRGVTFSEGRTTGNITAGQRSDTDLAISSYTASVRLSEFEPGQATVYNDLALALAGHGLGGGLMYRAGVIHGISGRGTYDLGTVRGYHIQDVSLAYANSTGSIISDTHIDNLTLTTGKVAQINTGSPLKRGDLRNSDITVAGDITSITIYGDIDNTDIVTSSNGTINLLYLRKVNGAGGSMVNGSSITVAGRVNVMNVQGDIDNSTLTILSGSAGLYSLNQLILGGNLFGTLNLHHNVNQIMIAGSLGQNGDELIVHGNLNSLLVGTDRTKTGSELGLDLVVLGNLGVVNVYGAVTGDITVQGNLTHLLVTADTSRQGQNILTGQVSVTEGIHVVQLLNGNLAGGILAGRDVISLVVSGGGVATGARIQSTFGRINTVMTTGDFDGQIYAGVLGDSVLADGSFFGTGALTVLQVGGTMGSNSHVEARSVNVINVIKGIEGGASILVEKQIISLVAGYIGGYLNEVDIVAGGITSIVTRSVPGVDDGNFYANLQLGSQALQTIFNIAGNFGGSALVNSAVTMIVRGNVNLYPASGYGLTIAGQANAINVLGDVTGALFIEKGLISLVAGSVTDAIITVGGQVNVMMVRGDVEDTLVQVGHWAGEDLAYASVDGQQDLGEQARRVNLLNFSARNLTNSIVAAGGNITVANITQAVTDSSISAGWSVGSLAIHERLNGQYDGDILRSQDGRELLSGNITHALAGSYVNSYVTAGVDAGVGGDFSNPTVLYENDGLARPVVDGGGLSAITVVRGLADADSRVLADSGITSNLLTGSAQVNANVTYTLADLEGASPLPASVGVASQGSPLTYVDAGGVTVTITVRGPGSVDLRDAANNDGKLDGLVITGTSLITAIDIKTSTPGQLTIGRILVEDDARIGTFSFDGKVVGDGTAALDVWFDGGVTTLNLGGLGDDQGDDRFTGVIGGDVTSFTLGRQDQGLIRVAGTVNLLRVNAGGGDPLTLFQQDYTGYTFDGLTIDGAGVWAYNSDGIHTIDPFNDNSVTSVAVVDATLGTPLVLRGLDIDPATGDLFGVAELYNQNPTVQAGFVNGNIHSLAVHPDGRLFAIHHDPSSHVDQLVQVDPASGVHTVIGTLRDGLLSTNYGSSAGSQVMSLAFTNDGKLLALLTDRQGADGGAASLADDISLAEISLTANINGHLAVKRLGDATGTLPPTILTTNGMQSYSGMAVNSAGQLFVVRDADTIVQIDINPLSVTFGQDLAVHALTGPSVSLVGIGFDASGNLIGLDEWTDRLYQIALDGSGTFTALSQTSLPYDYDHFAIGKSADQGGFRTYAYMVGGYLASNPGLVATLGRVDAATGAFSQIQSVVGLDGQPLTEQILDLAVDNRDPLATRLVVLTESGTLLSYDTDGQLVTGNSSQVTDLAVKLTAIDFDADGRLLGINGLGRQLVAIDLATGRVATLTEPGSVRGDVTTLTVDQVTGRGLVFNAADASVLSLAGLTQQAMSGLAVGSINSLTLGDGYANRVAATGGNINVVTLNGDFDGVISVPAGNVLSVTQTNGAFSGVLYSAGDVNSVTLRDADLLGQAVLWVDGRLILNVTSGLNHTGRFDGKVVAGHLASLNASGTQVSHAEVIVHRQADVITLGGDLAGRLDLANARSLTVNGQLLSGASIVSHGDVLSLNLRGGAQADTAVVVEGAVTTFIAGQTFSGLLAVRDGVRSASFLNLDKALVAIGLDTTIVTVQGNAVDSLISLGTWVGDDLAYNTLDDVITGGKVTSVTVLGQYRSSMLAAGVLPTFRREGFTPGTSSNFAFLGNPAATDLIDVDSAEAGGLLRSDIALLSIRGEIMSTNVATGRVAGVASADSIGRVITGQTGNILRQRVYNDPFGAPEILDLRRINNQLFEIILTEPVNTASILFDRDLNGDGLALNMEEYGSIEVSESFMGPVHNNLSATYTTRMLDGVERGVISVSTTGTFGASLPYVSLWTGGNTVETYFSNPSLFDRSGLRSAMTYFGGDLFGTWVR